jgi:sugar O-acyltransferase (sialic acid O-acetyltransferase NeuD family)
MTRLAILGASGHGKVIADAALAAGWQKVDFFDDAWPERTAIGRWAVLGSSAELLANLASYQGVVVGIGHCATRWKKHLELREAGGPLVSIVHPRAYVSPFATIGAGSVLFAGASVNVDAALGEACIVNTGASVDHDCLLADAVHISPGSHLSGNVSVGARTWIGVGANIRQGVQIGTDVTVGAGAVVVGNVANGQTVIGCPAKPMTF